MKSKLNLCFKSSVLFLVFMCFLIQPKVAYATEKLQSIRGVVLDAALGKPVSFATVKITSVKPMLGAVANKKGEFEIKNVPVGRHTILASMLSYKASTIDNVLVISGKENYLEIKLIEEIAQTGVVQVSAYKEISRAKNDLIVNSVTLLRPEAINRYAGSRNDPSKTAATSAGAASNNSLRNDIIIRGNSPLGVLWRIDGTDVPSPNHFMEAGAGGGIFGILNNNLLASSDFISGAFPTEYGNKIAGVFDINLRNGNNQQTERTFQLGMNGIEFGLEGPFSEDSKASYLANFRFVSLKPIESLGVEIYSGVIPQYLDGTIKINLPTENYGQFSLWAIGGNSSMSGKESEEEDIEWDKDTEKEDFQLSSALYALGLNHKLFYDENTFGELIISATRTDMATQTDIVTIDTTWLNSKYNGTEGSFQLRYKLTHKLSTQNLFLYGVTLTHNNFSMKYEDRNDDNILEQKLQEEGSANMLQSFIHWQYRPSDDLEFNAGVNYQLFTLNNSYSVEPRFSTLYSLNEHHNVSLGYGLHSQTYPLMHYFFKFQGEEGQRQPNLNLDMTKSHHLVLGYQNTMLDNIYFKAEAYVQYLYDVPVSALYNKGYLSLINLGGEFGMDMIDSLVNDGTGINYGVELTANKHFEDGYYVMFTGSLFKSYYTDMHGVERSTSFDMGHIANLIAGSEFNLSSDKKYIFSANIKFTSTGGRKGIPIDIEKSINVGDKVTDYSRAYDYSYGNFFQADLKLGLIINLESTTHDISFAIDNFTNHKNIFRESWDEEKNQIKKKYQLGLLPYLYYRINF